MPSVYCHFLDRELANVAGYRATTRRSAAALLAATLHGESPAFASLSGVHESAGITPLHRNVLPMLIGSGLFASTSDFTSGEEFLVSRRAIYAHDRRRYGVYFEPQRSSRSLFTPTKVKEVSATSALLDNILQTVLQTPAKSGTGENWGEVAAGVAQSGLKQRENEAITFALFRPYVDRADGGPDAKRMVAFGIRRAISIAYTRHQMSVFPGSRIIPGMWELGSLDSALAPVGAQEVPLLRWTIDLLSWADAREFSALLQLKPGAWHRWIDLCLGPDGREVRSRLAAWRRSRPPSAAEPGVASSILRSALSGTRRCPERTQNLLLAARRLWPRAIERDFSMSTTIMIHCVNDNERLGIVQACHEHGLSGAGPLAGTYAAAETLGTLSGRDLILVRSLAGSFGQSSAQGVVIDAIDEFTPRCVAAVGVAAGLKVEPSEGQPTVLITSRATDYERTRVGTGKGGKLDLRERGEVSNPDPILLGKLRVIADGLNIPCNIGQMLCGEKLVDFPQLRQELENRFPDALGVEMEATGIAGACARRGVPWVMLKGVSDRGDGTKSTFHADEDLAQREAARAAMMIVLEAVRHSFI